MTDKKWLSRFIAPYMTVFIAFAFEYSVYLLFRYIFVFRKEGGLSMIDSVALNL